MRRSTSIAGELKALKVIVDEIASLKQRMDELCVQVDQILGELDELRERP